MCESLPNFDTDFVFATFFPGVSPFRFFFRRVPPSGVEMRFNAGSEAVFGLLGAKFGRGAGAGSGAAFGREAGRGFQFFFFEFVFRCNDAKP